MAWSNTNSRVGFRRVGGVHKLLLLGNYERTIVPYKLGVYGVDL